MYKYKIYNSDNTVVAVSSFAKKPIRGVAKCDPTDVFSLETGTDLAVARCNSKIAAKRVKAAAAKLTNAREELARAQAHFDEMSAYYTDAITKLTTAQTEVQGILASL